MAHALLSRQLSAAAAGQSALGSTRHLPARAVDRTAVNRITVRDAEADEIDQIAKVWFDSWRDAHREIVPAELTAARTLESLRDRVKATLDDLRVVGDRGNPVGFAMVKDDELYQLFVADVARGTGVAAA